MGGRGSTINARWRQVFQPIGGAGGPLPPQQGAAPPQVQPGQPAPAITVQQLQQMSDQEFVDYLNALKSTPLDPNTYYNSDWDTQRLIANIPELNRAPQVVDAQTFASLPGESIYRTVNSAGTQTAVDICGRTMASDVTTIGSGRMGDGFYFSTDKSRSQRFYGNTSGNINRTATMEAKLNQNAKVIAEDTLINMLNREPTAVRSAVRNMRSDGMWSGSGYAAYALRKGYNTVRGGSVLNVIDRNAATWSGEITAKN